MLLRHLLRLRIAKLPNDFRHPFHPDVFPSRTHSTTLSKAALRATVLFAPFVRGLSTEKARTRTTTGEPTFSGVPQSNLSFGITKGLPSASWEDAWGSGDVAPTPASTWEAPPDCCWASSAGPPWTLPGMVVGVATAASLMGQTVGKLNLWRGAALLRSSFGGLFEVQCTLRSSASSILLRTDRSDLFDPRLFDPTSNSDVSLNLQIRFRRG